MSYTNFPNLNARIVAALKTGADFTANQLRTRFGIKSVSARISEIRQAGFPVYLNTKVTPSGNTIKVYRLGTPKRSTVALGLLVEEALERGSYYIYADSLRDTVAVRTSYVGN